MTVRIQKQVAIKIKLFESEHKLTIIKELYFQKLAQDYLLSSLY